MMLNRVSLNTIGLNRIGLNRIGKPSRGSSERPYIDPEVLASLKAVCICYGKSNDDPDRAVVKNLVDPDNPFVISNAAYTEGSGYADKGSPYYGAFVTDGIDDLITATKTVQEMLGGSNEITVVSMIHKMSSDANWSNLIGELKENHTFVANRVINTDKTGIYGYTYDGSKDAVVINNILGDEKDYTCRTAISLGLNNKYYVTGFENVGTIQGVLQVAWYWTFIANKVLTTDQINQVIAYFNLDRTLKPDILCNTIKQGITNENHAEFGDKLIDFSDNGRDIQLNNIAWKGDSGIGKYATDFTSWLNKPTETSHSKSILEAGNVLRTKSATSSMKVKVQFDKEAIGLSFRYFEGGVSKFIYINSNGEYSLPPLEEVGVNEWEGFSNNSSSSVTITQIPSHAGALCLDGVNDFGKVTGMPVYKDYTVVTDREIFANIGAILSKNNPGAFVETVGNSVYSFGQATSGLNFISTRSISYLSKYSYCGQSITAGAAEDGTDMWLGTIRDNDSRFFNGAIYSLMTFPYSMSEFLIERQLKKHKLGTLYPNMVEFRPIVKSNLPYSSISYSVNPGEYISVDSMVTITVTLPNTSDKLMEVSCNAISDISISGDNGVYEITGKVVKSPQKINMIISSYLTMLNNETLISNETLIKNE
ncbi:hypothetical protein F3B77_12020 [Bacteroides ovatus]|uniref:Uncharacterized protein n=1 Tax=Bacteroides ovatus TaxID=28116 RepID=A0A5M5M9S8_BACOV|nr:hypothetical protein [Bacteroides ovatus]KAA4070671.1 hypothetical protein F3D37_09365 [Bacteroides ovatus]KAA4078709.1 hypothetical protein F3D38_10400 [Bacteroides ovatus]KAA4097586.1 hypothetical protein F3D40_12345 [Bacteroides ovatus]KAA4112575.1 hypothetical protein F3D35_13280 [Bacteroides ovatus]KAA4114102.1 hypothetical protein F3D39_10595 [Bacteroides ovatus]